MKAKVLILVMLSAIGISCSYNPATNPYADVVNSSDKTVNVYFDNTKVCSVTPHSNSVISLNVYYENPVMIEMQFVKSNGASASRTLNYTFHKKYNYKIMIGSEIWEIQPYL